jgi:adenylosuccinate synthase
VFKAYVTRVGNGELKGELSPEETKARGWDEYGVVTGRPRRAAAFDMELARRAIALNSGTKIAICKLDVLFPEVSGATAASQLSEACLTWIKEVEAGCGTLVYCIGTGPDAQHTVFFE